MKPILRIPTRDANDSDHMAIMLLAGGILSFFVTDLAPSVQSLWFIAGIISLITAPLLWIRLPHVKWGGVLVSLMIGSIYILPVCDQAFTLKDSLLFATFLVIAYWFYKIDYNHIFPDQD